MGHQYMQPGTQHGELRIDDVFFRLQRNEDRAYIIVDFRQSLVGFKETFFGALKSVLQIDAIGNHESESWALRLPMPLSQLEVDTTLTTLNQLFAVISLWRREFSRALLEKRYAILH